MPRTSSLLAAATAAAASFVSTSSLLPLAAAQPPPPVFTCSSPSALRTLEVYQDGSYAVLVRGNPWLTDGRVAVHVGGTWYSSSPNATTTSLRLVGTTKTSGQDPVLGPFTKFLAKWATTGGAAPNLSFLTSFLCYESSLLTFSTTWPAGGANTNTSYPNGGWDTPISHFPSFAATGFAGQQAGWLLNGGIWTLFENWGVGVANGFPGSDGPLWLYNTSYAPSHAVGPPSTGSPTRPDVLIFCQLDNLKSTRVQVVPDPVAGPFPPRLVLGTYSTVQSVPAGFTLNVGLWSSENGINAATYEWGALMQSVYNTTRLPLSRDILNAKLTYFSDNGATLFQGYWDMVCPTRNCTAESQPPNTTAESVFLALRDYHRNASLPFALYQLDTWWFEQGEDYVKGAGLDCADWVPRADLFPSGLASLAAQMPLLLYSWGFVTPEKGLQMLNWTWEISIPQNEASVSLDQTYAFYSMIRDRFIAYGGVSFEEDNMGSYSSAWVTHQTAVDSASTWWKGFASPWCESGIPVQICESTASDLLESLKYPCVTSTRDNIDDVPGDHQDPSDPNAHWFLLRWHVGFDRMLIGALGLYPFFDNVWSMPTQPNTSWGNAAEYYVELAYILSVLGAGAVGIGDITGNTNRTLVMMGCMDDGTLLKPSAPSSYIEAVYLPRSVAPFDVTVGRVFQAISLIPEAPSAEVAMTTAAAPFRGALAPSPSSSSSSSSSLPPTAPAAAPFATVLAVDLNTPFNLLPYHLAPDFSAAINASSLQGYTLAAWPPQTSACTDGSPAYWCLSLFSDASPAVLNTGGVPQFNYTHNYVMVSLSPWYANGYALVGELGKIVRVSPQRFPFVTATTNAQGVPMMVFSVAGAPNEVVTVHVMTPPASTSGSALDKGTSLAVSSHGAGVGVDGIIRILAITMPAAKTEGSLSNVIVTCTGSGTTPCTW